MSKRKEEFSEITRHAFLSRLCLEVCIAKYDSVDDEISAEDHLCNYAAFRWGTHLLELDNLLGGNLNSYLNKDPSLKIALNHLLGTTQPAPSPAWVKWTTYIQSNYNYLQSPSPEIIPGWATQPASTAVARIALGLDLEPLSDAALKLSGKFCGHEIDLLALAVRCKNQAAIDLLRRKGFIEKPIDKHCMSCFDYYVEPYEDGCVWDCKTYTVIWS